MRIAVWILFPTLVASGICRAAPSGGPALIRSLRWSGVTVLSSSSLETELSSLPGSRFDTAAVRRDCESIRARYRNEGYWNAQAEGEWRYSSDSSAVDLSISVVEGRPAYVSRIVWEGGAIAAGDLELRFSTRAGKLFRTSDFEADCNGILALYESRGYPLAQCFLADVGVFPGGDADSLTLHLRVDEGARFTLDEVRIEGAKETDVDFILREMRIRQGELYAPERIRAARDRLGRLGIFASVAEPELYRRGEKGGVLFRLEEGKTNAFDGIVGYMPARGEAKGTVTGLVSISMRNLFGAGRKLSLRWERESSSSQEIGVRALEPWVAGLPVSLGGGFQQRQQDSAYVRRSGDLRIEVAMTERLSFAVVGGSESVLPSTGGEGGRAIRSSALTIGGDALYDSRDDAVNPTEGLRLRTSLHYGRKSLPEGAGSRRVALRRLDWDWEVYLSWFRGQVAAIEAHGRQVSGSDLQEADLFRFGGATTLRGYRENQFLGSTVAWIQGEYRFLTGQRSYLYGFVDGGYYQRPEVSGARLASARALLVGVGIGMRLETPLGLMGVSLAAGEGDTIGSMKVHVRLLSEF